jgi:hypothetical protein
MAIAAIIDIILIVVTVTSRSRTRLSIDREYADSVWVLSNIRAAGSARFCFIASLGAHRMW